MDAINQPLLRCPRPQRGVSPAERRFGRGRSYSYEIKRGRVRGRWWANPAPENPSAALVDPEAAAVSTASHSSGQHPLQGPRNCSACRSAKSAVFAGNDISIIFQEPMTSAQSAAYDRVPDHRNPAAAQRHQRAQGKSPHARTADAGRHSRAPRPGSPVIRIQLSGGQRQRVMIAMALANEAGSSDRG